MRRAIAPFVAAAAVACGGDGARSRASVRDSAGVQIVENTAMGAWLSGSAWTVADTPSLSIGGDDGDSTALFSGIQSVTRLSDGRIVVSNSRTRELRFFDASGRFVRAVGRMGAGPGEFDWLGAVLRTEGDSLILWDSNNGRLSVLDSSGRLIRSVPLRSSEAATFPEPFGWASDGSLIGRVGGRSLTLGEIRTPTFFVRHRPDLTLIDTIAERPGFQRFVEACGMGRCSYSTPFARTASAAFFGDRLYVGTADRFEISVIGVDGRQIRSIRVGVPNRPVTASDVARHRDEFLQRARDQNRRAQLERILADMKVPETMPAYQGLRVDRRANLWVEDYRVSDDDQPRWAVFDSTGALLGVLATPKFLRIDDIGDDYVLGVFSDSLDIEHVRMHRIVKPVKR